MFSDLIKYIRKSIKPGDESAGHEADDWIKTVNRLLKKYTMDLSDEEKFRLAENLTYMVYPQYLFSEYGRIYLEDGDYREFYERFMDPGNWHSYDRKFFLGELLGMVEYVGGDLAECGCYKGASAYRMCEFAEKSGRRVYLFDSFEGLSEPVADDGGYWKSGDLKSSELDVIENLRQFNCFFIHKGWIPDAFGAVEDKMFCFVHIDVDLYEPTLASLEFFYHKMNNNGVILFDDYGFKSCPGAKKAVDDFIRDKRERLIMVPTGQAFLQITRPDGKKQ